MNNFLKELILQMLTGNYFVVKNVIKKELALKKNEKLLDLGSGTGLLAPLFFPSQYVGIDIDSSLVAFAQKKLPQYEFLTMDSAKLNFPKDSFDKVLIVGVIHHLDKKTAKNTLVNIQKILKNNGEILAIEAIPPIHKANILGKIFREHDKGHHILSFENYDTLLSKSFSVVKSYKKKGGIFDYGIFVLKKI